MEGSSRPSVVNGSLLHTVSCGRGGPYEGSASARLLTLGLRAPLATARPLRDVAAVLPGVLASFALFQAVLAPTLPLPEVGPATATCKLTSTTIARGLWPATCRLPIWLNSRSTRLRLSCARLLVGGAKRRDQTAQHTLRRCRRWLEGEREELWEAQSRLPRRRRSDEDAAGLTAHQERCKAFAAEGELSRACSALVSPPLLGEDEEVSAKLCAKHPQCPPARPGMVPLGPPAHQQVPDLPVDQVLAAARSFRRGSAAGPSGLRGDHLREALAPLTATRLLPTSLLLSGSWQAALLRLSLRPTLGGPPSMPFPKGMTMSALLLWGNACAVLLVSAFVKPSKRRPSPLSGPYSSELQSRSAVRLLCTLFASGPTAMRATQPRLSSKLIFNTVDRAALLRQLRLRLPGLSPWAEWTYDRHSRLLFGRLLHLVGGRGAGPLLFALALHPALEAARSGLAPPDLVLAFLDDVCLAGDYRHVAASLARLTAAARQVGLELNPEKCEVVACAGADHCIDMRLFPAGVKTNASGAFSLLGAPIGPPAFCEAYTIKERVEKARPLLAELASQAPLAQSEMSGRVQGWFLFGLGVVSVLGSFVIPVLSLLPTRSGSSKWSHGFMQWKCAKDLQNTNGWEQFLICGDSWADVQRTQAGHEAVTRCGLDQSTMLTASLSTDRPIGWSKTAFWNAKHFILCQYLQTCKLFTLGGDGFPKPLWRSFLWLHRACCLNKNGTISAENSDRRFRGVQCTWNGRNIIRCLPWTEAYLWRAMLRSAESHTLDGDQRFRRCKATDDWNCLSAGNTYSGNWGPSGDLLVQYTCYHNSVNGVDYEKHVTDRDVSQTVSTGGGVSKTASTAAAPTYDCRWLRESVRAKASALLQIGLVCSKTFLQGTLGEWGCGDLTMSCKGPWWFALTRVAHLPNPCQGPLCTTRFAKMDGGWLRPKYHYTRPAHATTCWNVSGPGAQRCSMLVVVAPPSESRPSQSAREAHWVGCRKILTTAPDGRALHFLHECYVICKLRLVLSVLDSYRLRALFKHVPVWAWQFSVLSWAGTSGHSRDCRANMTRTACWCRQCTQFSQKCNQCAGHPCRRGLRASALQEAQQPFSRSLPRSCLGDVNSPTGLRRQLSGVRLRQSLALPALTAQTPLPVKLSTRAQSTEEAVVLQHRPHRPAHQVVQRFRHHHHQQGSRCQEVRHRPHLQEGRHRQLGYLEFSLQFLSGSDNGNSWRPMAGLRRKLVRLLPGIDTRVIASAYQADCIVPSPTVLEAHCQALELPAFWPELICNRSLHHWGCHQGCVWVGFSAVRFGIGSAEAGATQLCVVMQAGFTHCRACQQGFPSQSGWGDLKFLFSGPLCFALTRVAAFPNPYPGPLGPIADAGLDGARFRPEIFPIAYAGHTACCSVCEPGARLCLMFVIQASQSEGGLLHRARADNCVNYNNTISVLSPGPFMNTPCTPGMMGVQQVALASRFLHLASPIHCACYRTKNFAFPTWPSLHARRWVTQTTKSTYACPVHPLQRWLHIGQSVCGMWVEWGKGSSLALPGSVPRRRISSGLQCVRSLACHGNCPGTQDTTGLQFLRPMILWSQVLNAACWQEHFARGVRMPFQVPDNRVLMSGTSRRRYHLTLSLEARPGPKSGRCPVSVRRTSIDHRMSGVQVVKVAGAFTGVIRFLQHVSFITKHTGDEVAIAPRQMLSAHNLVQKDVNVSAFQFPKVFEEYRKHANLYQEGGSLHCWSRTHDAQVVIRPVSANPRIKLWRRWRFRSPRVCRTGRRRRQCHRPRKEIAYMLRCVQWQRYVQFLRDATCKRPECAGACHPMSKSQPKLIGRVQCRLLFPLLVMLQPVAVRSAGWTGSGLEHQLAGAAASVTCSGPTKYAKRAFNRARRRAAASGGTVYRGRFMTAAQLDAMHLSHAPPRRRAQPQPSQGKRLRIFSWNCGGLSQVFDSCVHWLHENAYDVAIIVETKWSFSSSWSDQAYHYVHSGIKCSGFASSGVLVMVSTKLTSAQNIRYSAIAPGRMLRVQFPTDSECTSHLEVIAVYQHVWDGQTKSLEDRSRVLQALSKTLHEIPARSQVVVAGDFNQTCRPLSRHIGCGVPAKSHASSDNGDLQTLVAAHQLIALNTWGTAPSFTFAFGQRQSQIDYIFIRLRDADVEARRSSALREFPLNGHLSAEAAQHFPIYANKKAKGQFRHAHAKMNMKFDLQSLAIAVQDEDDGRLAGLRQRVQNWCQTQTVPSASSQLDSFLGNMAVTELFPKQSVSKSKPWQDQLQTGKAKHMWQLFRIMRQQTGTLKGIFQAWRCWAKFSKQHGEYKARARQLRRDGKLELLNNAREAARRGDTWSLYKLVRRIAPKAPQRKFQVQPKGKLLTLAEEHDELITYYSSLYDTPHREVAQRHVEEQVAISVPDVEHAICSIPLRKSVDSRSAPGAAYRACADLLAPTIVQVMQIMWGSSRICVPSIWSIAELLFLPKPGKNTYEVKDWRPIGLQSPLGKAVMHWLIQPVKLCVQSWSFQFPLFAYMSGRSTAQALQKVFRHCKQVREICASHEDNLHNRFQGWKPAKPLSCWVGCRFAWT